VRTAKRRVRSILAGALGALLLITGLLHGATDEGRVKAGIEAYEHHDYPKAIQLLAPLIQPLADPREMAAVAALGFSYYFTESYEKALPYLQQAAVVDKDNIELNYAFGLAALRLRRSDEGRSAFARIYRVSPESA
jgi:tetratricopeptide (TPR) repeat protein